MIIIPAIDLKDGNVVRLFQGKGQATVYSHNPLVVARHWQNEGAKLIHIVDLDGAFTGEIKHIAQVKKIAKALDVPLEFGGGIRDKEAIDKVLSIGVKRVVLGTKAAEDQLFLKMAIDEYGDAIVVSIDAKDGIVVTRGWQESTRSLEAVDFANQLYALGLKEIIYTDISKDGTLRGPNIPAIKQLLDNTSLTIIASGGISCLNDIKELAALKAERLKGVIVGKALYEEKFTLKDAQKTISNKGGVS